MTTVNILQADSFYCPTDNKMYLVSKIPPGTIPKKRVTIVLNKETWHVRHLRPAKKLKYTEQTVNEKNGQKRGFGKIELVSPLRFKSDGTILPFDLKLPELLQREMELGETEVHLIFDIRGPVETGPDVADKIAKQKRKIWATGKA